MKQNNFDPGLQAGTHLKSLIKESKWKTQEDFAFDFGVDVRTVRRWINQGISNIYTIWELAEFFDVDALTFFS